MNKVTFCKYCYEHGKDKIEGRNRCADCFDARMNRQLQICPICNHDVIPMSIDVIEIDTILDISGETSFILAMDELKQKDPIEFQLKMSQFKTQLQQQNSNTTTVSNTPKCPTCGSTNIKKISGLAKARSVAMFGILSRKVHKQWHCNSCGSEW